jgi:hypothetical protein
MNHRFLKMAAWPLMVLILAAALALPAGAAPVAPEDPQGVKFAGVIDAVGAESWTVAGHVLAIAERTRIQLTGGPAEPGMWADVAAHRETDGGLTALRIAVMPPEMRLKGAVQDLPAGNIGVWTVAGQAFQVTEDTRISSRSDAIVIGSWVAVFAKEEPAGTLVAVRIRRIDPLPAVEIFGAIQAASQETWTLSSIPLRIDADTLINGEPQVGLLALGAAELQADDTLLALRLRVNWHEVGGERTPVSLTGAIEQLPPRGLNGRWKVAGVPVLVGPNTAIYQTNGLAVVGAEVQIDGWEVAGNEDGIVAETITVLTSPIPGGQPVRFTGLIDDLPDDGLIGVWVVDGQQVRVTESTQLRGEHFARVGVRAHVWAWQLDSGEVMATVIHIQPPRPSEAAALPTG